MGCLGSLLTCLTVRGQTGAPDESSLEREAIHIEG